MTTISNTCHALTFPLTGRVVFEQTERRHPESDSYVPMSICVEHRKTLARTSTPLKRAISSPTYTKHATRKYSIIAKIVGLAKILCRLRRRCQLKNRRRCLWGYTGESYRQTSIAMRYSQTTFFSEQSVGVHKPTTRLAMNSLCHKLYCTFVEEWRCLSASKIPISIS